MNQQTHQTSIGTKLTTEKGVQVMKRILEKVSGARNWLIAFYILAVLVLSITAKASIKSYTDEEVQPNNPESSFLEIESIKQDLGFFIVRGLSHTLCLEPLHLEVAEVSGDLVKLTLAKSELCSPVLIETPFETSISINSLGLISGTYNFVMQGPEGTIVSPELSVQVTGTSQPELEPIEVAGMLRMLKGGTYELTTDRGVYYLYSEIIDLNNFVNRNVVVLIKESVHHVGPVLEIAQDPLPSNAQKAGSNEMFFYALSIKLM